MKKLKLKSENSFDSPGTYRIEFKGEMISHYLYYLQMKSGFCPALSRIKGKSSSAITGIVASKKLLNEVVSFISGYGYEVISVKKI